MDPDALTFDDEVANEYKQQQTAHKDDIKREPQDESYATDPFGEKYDDLDGGMIKLEEQKVLYEDENGFGDSTESSAVADNDRRQPYYEEGDN